MKQSKTLSDKQQDFVNTYCSNGHNASKAYRTVYPDSASKSAESSGIRLLRNAKISKAIEAYNAKSAKKQARTAESIDLMYQEAYDLAKKNRHTSAMNQAATGIARLYGLDKDASVDLATPEPLSNETIAFLLATVKTVTDNAQSKPMLYSEEA